MVEATVYGNNNLRDELEKPVHYSIRRCRGGGRDRHFCSCVVRWSKLIKPMKLTASNNILTRRELIHVDASTRRRHNKGGKNQERRNIKFYA